METNLLTGPIVMLLAFLLGAGAAWVWLGKRLSSLEEQGSRLRRDRRTLAHRLTQANGRLDSANFNRTKVDEQLATLQTAHDELEADHARLVVNYANLKRGVQSLVGEDDWFEALDDEPESRGSDVPVAALQADSRELARAQALQELAAFEVQLGQATRNIANNERPFQNEAAPGAADLQADSTAHIQSDTQSESPADLQSNSENNPPAVFRTDTAVADADWAARIDAEQAQAAQLRAQLARQQAEISRLQEQLAPLLGLPLAVSAREAERDSLVQRLVGRESELARLHETVSGLTRNEAQLRDQLHTLQVAADAAAALAASAPEKTGKNRTRKKNKTGKNRSSIGPSTQLSELRVAPSGSQDVGLPGVSADRAERESEPIVGTLTPRQFRQAPDSVDNLKEIKGIGPALERLLNRLGVYQFRQIASWSDEDIAYFDNQLADFRGRIQRDDWVSGAHAANQRKYEH